MEQGPREVADRTQQRVVQHGHDAHARHVVHAQRVDYDPFCRCYNVLAMAGGRFAVCWNYPVCNPYGYYYYGGGYNNGWLDGRGGHPSSGGGSAVAEVRWWWWFPAVVGGSHGGGGGSTEVAVPSKSSFSSRVIGGGHDRKRLRLAGPKGFEEP